MARNPDWTRDEIILALDLYVRHDGQLPSRAEVVEMSGVLRRLAGAISKDATTFRNENSVLMKLGNIQAIDARYTERQKKKGLTRGGKTERAVWSEFAHDPARLRAVATAIVAALGSEVLPQQDDGDQFVDAPEGRLLSRMHRVRERNAGLRKKKIAAVLKSGKTVCCEVCSFDYGRAYGQHGDGFIEVHHLRPLHELTSETRTRLDELALVCANCHRMIHARKPWLSMDEIKELVSASTTMK